jgi:tripartite-type tricarboxylate transporter receptor subunit TctC
MSHIKSIARRNVLLAGAAAAAVSSLPLLAHAQAFPSKPVTFVVPWPAGSTSDSVMRSLVHLASQSLGQAIVVENKAGASGMLGVSAMAQAKPDGYTIGQIPLSVTRFSQVGTLKIDPRKDLTPIGLVAGLTFGIVVKPESPHKTMNELLAFGKANPGKLTYGTAGVGNQTHIGMEIIEAATGVKFTHVPYKGGNEATQGLLGGHVDMVADSSGWAPLVLQGKLRLLCVWGGKRLTRFPDVPTMKELGYDVSINAPGGVAGPAGMPADVQAKLAAAFEHAAKHPEFQAALDKFDMPLMYQAPAEYKKTLEQSYTEETALIQKLNLREVLK